MSSLMSTPVLVLNSSYEGINITPAYKAIKLLLKDVAVVERDTGLQIHACMILPSVIRLKTYRRIPPRIHEPSRKNIYIRDKYCCQYCGKSLRADKLTLDHIIPQSRGGQKNWENLVASCQPCNHKKADRTPDEAGMRLINKPQRLTIHTNRHIMRNMGASDPLWREYLYFD